MKKISTLSILFLAVCAFLLVLMRSCGGSEELPVPTSTLPPVTEEPSIPPIDETPTPVVLTTPEPVDLPIWTTDGVNLRRSADTKADVLTVVPKDEQLRRLDYPDNGWVHVKYNDIEGYVSESYVTKDDPAASAPEAQSSAEPGATAEPEFVVNPCSDTVWATDGVNLRRGPGTEYDIAGSVNKDTKLERTGTTDNGWSRVLYNSVGYFVSSDFVTTTAPAVEEENGEKSDEAAAETSEVTANVASSGEFKSDTGVNLNILVRWDTVSNGDGTLNLNLSAALVSGPLTAAQYADNLCFKVGNDTFNKTAPAIELTENTTVETPLGSQSVKVSPGSVPVSVSWRFNGTYSEKQIDQLVAETTLILR